MPSGERETVTAREFVRPLTRHYICRSLAAEKFHQAVPVPGLMDGGVLDSRMPSFSAGLARKYTSVVLLFA